MPSPAITARLALLALLVAACGQTTPLESAADESSAVASAGVSDSTQSAPPSSARLPTAFGPPEPLEPGTYLTPERFEPVVSISVGEGWYGTAGQLGFAVGQGLDDGEFADAGLYGTVVPVAYDEAVATFGELEGVVFSEPSSSMKLDGHDATVFHGGPLGDQVPLDELVPGIDLNTLAHQQMFVDVDGQTLLIRTELRSDDAESALTEVIDSIRFP